MHQTLVLKEHLPEVGDAVMIINRGEYFEMIYHRVETGLELTEEDCARLRAGEVTFN